MEHEPTFEKISEDERGANYRVLLPNGQELVLIYTKAGHSRGGHSHNAREVAMPLTGKVRITKMLANVERVSAFPSLGRRTFVVLPGETYRNEPGEPHMGEFLEDSWLIDWKIDAKAGEFTTTNYPPFREIVAKKK